jgi:hypothetical protein
MASLADVAVDADPPLCAHVDNYLERHWACSMRYGLVFVGGWCLWWLAEEDELI